MVNSSYLSLLSILYPIRTALGVGAFKDYVLQVGIVLIEKKALTGLRIKGSAIFPKLH